MRHIVVYELNLWYLIKLSLGKKKKLQVLFINSSPKNKFLDRSKIFLLSHLSIATVLKKPYYLRDFPSVNDVSIQFQVVEDASNESIRLAHSQLEKFGLLSELPPSYIKNLILILATEYYDQVLIFFRQTGLFRNAFDYEKYELHVWLNRALFQLGENRNFPGVIILPKIPSWKRISLDFLIFLTGIISLLTNLSPLFSVKKQDRSIPILCTHRDEFHSSTSFRNKLDWFFNLDDDSLEIFCFRTRKYQKKFPSMGNFQMPNVIDGRRYFQTFSKFQTNKSLIKRLLSLQLRNSRLLTSGQAKFGVLNVWRSTILFLWGIESNSHSIRRLKAKFYVYEDIYWEVHVFNTLAELGLIKTIKLQYSNLPWPHVLMMSNPSTFMALSERFTSSYQCKPYGVGPKQVITMGYPLPIKNCELVKRSKKLKKSLNESGASFIIGFFPESVQRDRDIWAFFTDSDYLRVIHRLSNLVISDPEIGIVLKTQFMRRNPLKIFPHDEILHKAFETGRFLIPEFGIHRNLVTPTEIALASDICIGDIAGATASLEAALAGTRSIMIDSMNFGPKYRAIYFASDQIVFKDLDYALNAIIQFKVKEKQSSPIGQWGQILNELQIVKVNTNQLFYDLMNSSV